MKKIFLSIITFIVLNSTFAQEKTDEFSIYNDKVDPTKQLSEAIAKAQTEKKNIFLQIGGNWCICCKRFNSFTTSDKEIDSIMSTNFVVVLINYSKEN